MRLALITGTTRGLGLALATELLERGWTVTGFARGAAPTALGGRSAYEHVRVDLADLAALEGAARALAERRDATGAERFALVNNAGVLQPMQPLAGVEWEALDRAFRVNAVAPTWLMGFALEARPRGALTIVNVSSGAATKAYPSWGAYCATKAALAMAGRVLAAEAEAQVGVGAEDRARAECRPAVVSYAPHVVATAMQEEIRATPVERFPLRSRFVELHQSGALVEPREPAREMADLCERDDLPLLTETRYEPR